ncbi:Transcription factor-like protein DPB [Acorus gramineus]|uniref:Transcription factor-like protein DPB n=1 Tax=Acorus gramineus TaxID=55184 RepID=A0AAV9B115_ACOGR|nr:Transcription factor-like protein DPB [Acorus gramineus]
MKRPYRLLRFPFKNNRCLLASSLLALSLLLILTLQSLKPHRNPSDPDRTVSAVQSDLPNPPRLAYLISGSSGDGPRLRRILQASYHPLNRYLLQLDLSASAGERADLVRYVGSVPAFIEFDNVRVVGEPDVVTYKGPTVVAATLHGVAVLLKETEGWDWFVNLNASDYPLMSQDDVLDGTFGVRSLFNGIKTTGSACVVLSRSFLEFCIWGWDNLPRTLLMYYTNFLSSSESYFHTVLCNSQEFQNTTINHDLHYVVWDNPPGQQPITLTSKHFEGMAASGAPFARLFDKDDPVLDLIDRDLLRRSDGQLTPGGWCVQRSVFGGDPCSVFGNPAILKPSLRSRKLESLMLEVLDVENFRVPAVRLMSSMEGDNIPSVFKEAPICPSSNTEQATSSNYFKARMTEEDVQILSPECASNKRRESKFIGGGLRQLSFKVVQKIASKGRTTYNEVADEIVAEYGSLDGDGSSLGASDEKNIRRRVYDAINVLIATEMIAKDKKEIQWLGHPRTIIDDITELEEERMTLMSRVQTKTAYLQELQDQVVGLHNLVLHNQKLQESGENTSKGIALPFLLVQTDRDATVEVEISEDMKLIHFDFDGHLRIVDFLNGLTSLVTPQLISNFS